VKLNCFVDVDVVLVKRSIGFRMAIDLFWGILHA
jgi:hypothetical protein